MKRRNLVRWTLGWTLQWTLGWALWWGLALGPVGCGDKKQATQPKPKTAVERRLRPAATVDIKQTASKIADSTDELLLPYVFRWPLDNIDVTSPYGVRQHPVVRRLLFHSGVDFRAPRGEPVLSAGPGLVAQAGWLPLTGNTVTVNHPGQLITLYAHLDEILVFPGQQVNAGAPVGLIGSTGRSTGPHLHWSVYLKRGKGRHPLAPSDFIGRLVDPRTPPRVVLPPPPKKKLPKPTLGH
jgi:murein DD-endopeptidase MepM/ murein hydrolase activator NlpD